MIKVKKRKRVYFLLCEGEPICYYPSYDAAETDKLIYQALDELSGYHSDYKIESGYRYN